MKDIMKIRFSLAWAEGSKALDKNFKSRTICSLFKEYLERIAKFMPCEGGAYLPKERSCVWVCEREKGSRTMNSEDLARAFQQCMNSGVQELQVVIGGADGFTAGELEKMNPALRWSFGPMTLPHELASVVAAEQIYRALTIIHHQPYHSGH